MDIVMICHMMVMWRGLLSALINTIDVTDLVSHILDQLLFISINSN
jgi:hypothetical protein